VAPVDELGLAAAVGKRWTGQPLHAFDLSTLGGGRIVVREAAAGETLRTLDGGRIAVSLLPMRAAQALSRVEPYGLFVIVALLALGVLDNIMDPLLRFGEWALQTLIGL